MPHPIKVKSCLKKGQLVRVREHLIFKIEFIVTAGYNLQVQEMAILVSTASKLCRFTYKSLNIVLTYTLCISEMLKNPNN